MTPIDFYYQPMSPPCRAVLMAAKSLGVELKLRVTNLVAGEHLTKHFLHMNPQHTIPTIDDNGFYLYESRAIIQYLANAYGGADDDSLYPTDPKKRALIDSRFQFDLGTLYKAFAETYYPLLFQRKWLSWEKVKEFNDSLTILEGFLEKTLYVAGRNLTIADFSIMATLSTAEACEHDFSGYPKILNYMTTCKKEILQYSKLNEAGATEFGILAKRKIK